MNDIQFPSITVGGRSLTVRYSIAAQVLMRRRGIDPRHLVRDLSVFKLVPNDRGDDILELVDGKPVVDPSKDATENLLTAFSCMVAENSIDQANADKFDLNSAPRGDYWATQLDPLQMSEVDSVIWAAVGKVMEARRKLQLVAVPPVAQQSAGAMPTEQAS